jgi:hypothetical protein
VDINALISSGLLESYVTGNATEKEAELVRELSALHPYVQQEIEAIEAALIEYANQSLPEISPSVKEKIFAQLPERQIEQPKQIPLPEAKKNFTNYLVAAALLLLATSIALNIFLYGKLGRTSEELKKLSLEKNYYSGQLKVQKAVLDNSEKNLRALLNENTIPLELKATDPASDYRALIFLNKKTNETWLKQQNLPALPSGKQYQLWAIVNGKPVSAGVFEINTGKPELQLMKTFSGTAEGFAVTVENLGGVDVPTLSSLCLSGTI